MRRLLMIGVSVFCVIHPAGASDLVERFLAREDVPVMRFVAMRRLEASNERFKKAGWMEACVAQDPERGFTFRITGEGGSGYIRDKVLRKALEGERDLVNTGAGAKATLSPANYDMSGAAASTALGETAIVLTPKRKDGLLVDGRAVVTDPEGDLLRVEGKLVKTPSWWTRSVHVVRRYARVGGVRVPVETESTADVRIVGRSHFRMRSSFVSINGTTVEIGPEVARSACLVTQN